jgi:hypothetical protein
MSQAPAASPDQLLLEKSRYLREKSASLLKEARSLSSKSQRLRQSSALVGSINPSLNARIEKLNTGSEAHSYWTLHQKLLACETGVSIKPGMFLAREAGVSIKPGVGFAQKVLFGETFRLRRLMCGGALPRR